MLPATGSTMMQATWSPISSKHCSTASGSLYGRVTVCSARAAGTPGELGSPWVRAPEPALTSSESEWPW